MNLIRFQRPEMWGSTSDPLINLRQEINRLFDSPWGDFTRETEFFNRWTPALDLYEDKDNFVVRVELPGMKKSDIEISIHEGNLSVSGERKYEDNKEGEVSRSERFFGRFQRTLALPKAVDVVGVKANYKDGILSITLPKTEESKPKQIEVKVS
jgi:HSP20 family protein